MKFPSEPTEPTKRGILAKVARVYDPLGLVAPTILLGKLLYRDVCDAKLAWDTTLPEETARKLKRWEAGLPTIATTNRSLAIHHEEIQDIQLHSFGDASGKGVASAVYAVVTQPSGVSQGLVMTAKARLTKQGLTIPRLELVSGHMAINLVTNVKHALEGFNVSQLYCWLDSSVALHWIRGNGNYKQFVNNRVKKINQHNDVKWRYVSTEENPADLGSRGGTVSENGPWWNGPAWLSKKEEWLADITTSASPESKTEEKVLREVFAGARVVNDVMDALLKKFSYGKLHRVSVG